MAKRATRPRVLYVFTARKQRLLDSVKRREAPDTLLFGLNHLENHDIDPTFHEPEYGRVGRRVAHQAGRLGPDFLQLRTLPLFSRCDAVFLTGGWPLLFAAQAIPRARRPKLIWLNMTLTNVIRRGGAIGKIVARAARLADFTVCVAEFQRDFLHRELGIPLHMLPLVLSGTDATFYDPARESPSQSMPGAASQVLAAGRDAGRDYATLARATNSSNWDARIICSPQNVAGVALPPNATVRTDIAPHELRREYASANIVVVPTAGEASTAGSDCSGTLVLLDALAMGKPVVITERQSVHDYVRIPDHALSTPPNSPSDLRSTVEQLLGDPAYSAEMAAQGRAHVLASRTTTHFASGLANVIHAALGTR